MVSSVNKEEEMWGYWDVLQGISDAAEQYLYCLNGHVISFSLLGLQRDVLTVCRVHMK